MRPAGSVATPCGSERLPGPVPCLPNENRCSAEYVPPLSDSENACMRWLLVSATYMRSSPPTAMPCGWLKRPLSAPKPPKLCRGVPSAAKTCTRWLPVSITYMRSCESVATECGNPNEPPGWSGQNTKPGHTLAAVPNDMAWLPSLSNTCTWWSVLPATIMRSAESVATPVGLLNWPEGSESVEAMVFCARLRAPASSTSTRLWRVSTTMARPAPSTATSNGLKKLSGPGSGPEPNSASMAAETAPPSTLTAILCTRWLAESVT